MANKSEGSAETVVLRKFGINENYQLAMYLLDQYRGTVLSCRYIIPSNLAPAASRRQLEQAIKVAVVDTVMRHPMMQVGMIDVGAKVPSWIQLQSLDLAQHIKWHYIGEHDDDFERTVQTTFRAQLDEYFPDLSVRQPGWKLTLIRQGDARVMEMLLTWNHPQFDGAGARVIHEDMLEMLNHGQDRGENERPGLDGHILTLPRAPPMLPTPLESLVSLPLDLGFFLKALWEEIRPQVLNWDASLATWCPIRSTPYKTQYRTFFVDESSLQTILSLCREHKTTITALLNGLALIAFSSRLDSKAAPAFQSSTIIDHRRNLPPAPIDAPWASSDRTVGNYVTQLPHRYDAASVARIRSLLAASKSTSDDEPPSLSPDLQRELWAISASSRAEIVRKLAHPLRNDIVGLFKWVADWKKTMRDMAGRTRQFSWLVTNVGVLDGSGGGSSGVSGGVSGDDDGKVPMERGRHWAIERAQFGLSAEIPAAAIEFAPISVAGHGMCVSAQWHDCAVEVAFAEGIMADLERWIRQLAKGP